MIEHVLIIGGGGFLGRWILKSAPRNLKVSVFDIRRTDEDASVDFIVGDITNKEQITNACKGITAVIHSASPNHGKGKDIYYKVNVVGTANIIDACIATGVKYLVYTSSASVVFDGSDIFNGKEEELDYCKKHMDYYNETKAAAEKAVLAANGTKGLLTCCIRPAAIFGPGDVQGWPEMLKVGESGKTWAQIGDNSNLMDWTYVENVADAHWLALKKLKEKPAVVGGQAYFITNCEPEPFWNMIHFVWDEFGYSSRFTIPLPTKLMLFLVFILEFLIWILSPIVTISLNFTRFRIINATATRYFSNEKARKHLGYKPAISLQEGKKRTAEYFKTQLSTGKLKI